MTNDGKRGGENEGYLELKYCERCGGLWLREGGGSRVYCYRCQPLMDELPTPLRRPPMGRLPAGPLTTAEDLEFDIHDIDALAWFATGGAA